MTQYRVGQAGATVFNEHGNPVAKLRPGYVVIEGTIDTAGSLADQRGKEKRRKGYADKAMRAGRDYADKSL